MRKTYIQIAALVAGLLLAAEGAVASLVLSDSFAYPDGNLVGQGPWVASSQTGQGSGFLQVTSGLVSLAGPTSGQYAEASLGTSLTSGSVYYGVDLTISAAKAGSTAYFLTTRSTGSSYGERLYAETSGAGFVLGTGVTSQTPVYGSSVLNFNQDYRVVLEYDYIAGVMNDTCEVYVDPTDSNPANDSVYVQAVNSTSGDNSASSFFDIRQATNAPTATIGNLDVATDFASAAAVQVPEPSMAQLAGLVGMVALLRRRR